MLHFFQTDPPGPPGLSPRTSCQLVGRREVQGRGIQHRALERDPILGTIRRILHRQPVVLHRRIPVTAPRRRLAAANGPSGSAPRREEHGRRQQGQASAPPSPGPPGHAARAEHHDPRRLIRAPPGKTRGGTPTSTAATPNAASADPIRNTITLALLGISLPPSDRKQSTLPSSMSVRTRQTEAHGLRLRSAAPLQALMIIGSLGHGDSPCRHPIAHPEASLAHRLLVISLE